MVPANDVLSSRNEQYGASNDVLSSGNGQYDASNDVLSSGNVLLSHNAGLGGGSYTHCLFWRVVTRRFDAFFASGLAAVIPLSQGSAEALVKDCQKMRENP